MQADTEIKNILGRTQFSKLSSDLMYLFVDFLINHVRHVDREYIPECIAKYRERDIEGNIIIDGEFSSDPRTVIKDLSKRYGIRYREFNFIDWRNRSCHGLVYKEQYDNFCYYIKDAIKTICSKIKIWHINDYYQNEIDQKTFRHYDYGFDPKTLKGKAILPKTEVIDLCSPRNSVTSPKKISTVDYTFNEIVFEPSPKIKETLPMPKKEEEENPQINSNESQFWTIPEEIQKRNYTDFYSIKQKQKISDALKKTGIGVERKFNFARFKHVKKKIMVNLYGNTRDNFSVSKIIDIISMTETDAIKWISFKYD